MTANIPSLKSDFEFFASDNGLSQIIKVDEEIIENDFEFKTELSLKISRRSENKSTHGKPNRGINCKNLNEAGDAANYELDKLTVNEIEKITHGSSSLLKMKSGNLTLDSGDFYVVNDCRKCSTEGKIPCGLCNARGHSSCNNCAGNGKINCQHCYGSGRIKCSSCGGLGKKVEYNYSIQDDEWDRFTKNNGAPVYRQCTSCTGRGDNFCSTCSGYKKLSCSACSGDGIITCSTCNGASKVTCKVCAGYGCNSDVTTKIVDFQSSHKVSDLTKFDVLIKKSVSRSHDDFLAGSKFKHITKKEQAGQNKIIWNIIASNKHEKLSVVSKTAGNFAIGRFSGSNNTVSTTKFLDKALIDVASDALSEVNSIAEFKEKVSEFPGVIRWAFGEKVQSPKHAVVRPMYDGLLSEDGKEEIFTLKSDYLSRASKNLIYKFMLMTIPVSLAIMLALVEHFYKLNSISYFSLACFTVVALACAYWIAEVISEFYVSRISKL